jgi:hypothetical protein
MKFNSKEISISDEEFGCTLTLSEKEDDSIVQMNMTIKEVMDSLGQYVLLQRTYPEDDFESDYYYIEASDPGKSGELINFSVDLYRRQFLMTYKNELFEIGINPNDQEFGDLKKALEKIINNEGQLIIHD